MFILPDPTKTLPPAKTVPPDYRERAMRVSAIQAGSVNWRGASLSYDRLNLQAVKLGEVDHCY
jgi:hypothetical protein